MKKYLLTSLFVFLGLLFTGCQNTKVDPVIGGGKGSMNSVSYGDYSISDYTNEIDVKDIDTIYDINLTLSQYDLPLVEEEVAIKVFDADYGEIISSYVKTDANGKAKFKYISPSVLPLEGTTIYITYLIVEKEEDVEVKTFLEAPVKINFN